MKLTWQGVWTVGASWQQGWDKTAFLEPFTSAGCRIDWEKFCALFPEWRQQVSNVQSLTLAAKLSSSLPCQEWSYSPCQALTGGTICLTLHNSSRPYLTISLATLTSLWNVSAFLHLKRHLQTCYRPVSTVPEI